MKTLSTYAVALLFAICNTVSTAAFAGGSIIGKVTDPDTQMPVSGANIVLENNGTTLNYMTNEAGFFYASNIPAGNYVIIASYQGNDATITEVKIDNDEVKDVEIPLSMTLGLPSIEVKYTPPPIDIRKKEDMVIDIKEIKNLPVLTPVAITELVPGVVPYKGEYYIRGSRAGSTSYYIDGCKVMGTPNIPLCGLQTYRAYTSYVPAKYGDCTGGVIVMETRNYFSE